MTSTTSRLDWAFIAAKSALLVYAAVLMAVGYAVPQQSQPSAKTRIVTPPTAEPALAPPAPPAAEPAKEPPYYGSTYWDEVLTSVYYYPGESKNDVPLTHLKFGHREDDIHLCGDQRKSFEPGNRYRLTVTFEPNQPCATNWRIK